MTKIRIDIDTESNDSLSGDNLKESKSLVMTANKVGLLSTIKLSPNLSGAFWSAVGQNPEEKDDLKFKDSDLGTGKDYLKNSRNCKAIATVGGLTAFNAVNGANDIPFVSLVGWIPSALSTQCKGGVSLESYNSSLRRQYLIDHFPGVQLAANIYLLTTNLSASFHQAESNAWNYSGTFTESYAADNTGATDATKLSWDWLGSGGNPAKIPNTATAVIISDDPFFQVNQQSIISQANTWLGANGTRRVVFPSKNWSIAGQTHAGQMIVMGCDLVAAYRLLGALAASLSLNPNVNFGFIRLAPEPV